KGALHDVSRHLSPPVRSAMRHANEPTRAPVAAHREGHLCWAMPVPILRRGARLRQLAEEPGNARPAASWLRATGAVRRIRLWDLAVRATSTPCSPSRWPITALEVLLGSR